jgi:hypothetical protein
MLCADNSFCKQRDESFEEIIINTVYSIYKQEKSFIFFDYQLENKIMN